LKIWKQLFVLIVESMNFLKNDKIFLNDPVFILNSSSLVVEMYANDNRKYIIMKEVKNESSSPKLYPILLK